MGRLTKSFEFKEVFSRGKKFSCRHFILFIKENGFPSHRIGLAVSRKTGSAVTRNRVKRIYREAFRRAMAEINESYKDQKYHDFVFVGKRECADASMQEVFRELKMLLKRYREAGS